MGGKTLTQRGPTNRGQGMSAAIKRRSPWDAGALSMATLFLLIFVIVIAGVHADGVARAINC
jgi:hypothetical protein